MLRKQWLHHPAFVGTLLVLVIFAVYFPVLSFDFLQYDDPDYVTHNPRIFTGLTPGGLVWAFTHVHASNWHPLTWVSHMLDCQVYGLNAAGHHFTNVLFHAANSLLIFFLLRKWTGLFWQSVGVACLFALHPLHVESVAWVSERKDVLSTFFGLLALLAYTHYATFGAGAGEGSAVSASSGLSKRAYFYYFLALLLFALGLMSKPMLVTFPCLLLLVDWWPLRRLDATTIRGRFVEKIPFFALTALSCVITFMAQRAGGAVAPLQGLSISARLQNAPVSYLRYLEKTFWPSDLAFTYPFQLWPPWVVLFAIAAVIAVTLLLILNCKGRPHLLVGWAWYIGTLVPVIGIIQVGLQSMADRYMYWPSIGLFICIVWAAAELIQRKALFKLLAAPICVGLMFSLALTTEKQLLNWFNTETLFSHAITRTVGNAEAYNTLGRYFASLHEMKQAEQCYASALKINPTYHYAWNNLGCVKVDEGKSTDAIQACGKAIELSPSFAEAHNNLGTALLNAGEVEKAIGSFENAIRLRPDYEEAHYNLGNAYAAQNRIKEARQQFQVAAELNPSSADAHNNLGFMLLRENLFSEAGAEFGRALSLDPNLWQAYFGLGTALQGLGQWDAAVSQFQQLLQRQPENPGALLQLGVCWVAQDKLDPAINSFRQALKARPDDASAHFHLARALKRKGQPKESIQHYQQALAAMPDSPAVLDELAWTMATAADPNVRDGAKALGMARRACELTQNQQPLLLATLAAAYAEAGSTQEALRTLERAEQLAGQSHDLEAKGKCKKLRAALEAGNPFHET